MKGLILAGLGKGIADAGATYGNMMTRQIEAKEAAERRAAEREEDREFRRQQDALYRKPVDSAGSSGSGSSGGKGGGGISVATQAAEAGMTVPEYEAYWKAQETGDMSPFKRTQTVEDESGGHSTSDLPPGFEQEYKAKMRVLGEIRKKAELGKDYQNVAAGEQTAFETGLGQGVIGGKIDPTKASQATSVMKGSAPFGGDSNVTRNVLTGDTKTTKVGDSAIRENDAQAGKARSDAGGGDPAKARTESLTTEAETLRKAMDSMTDKKLKEQYRARLDRVLDELEKRRGKVDNNAGKPDNSPKQTSQFKVGETRTVQSGPNKGKTARWDGKGWALVN